MKTLFFAILILTLNNVNAQPNFPGGKPMVKTTKGAYVNNLWQYDASIKTYSIVYKLNAVNLQRSIAEFKKLLELNGTTEYKDKSIWSEYTKTDDYGMMELDIMAGRGELLYVQGIGDYVYGLRCSQELDGFITILVVKIVK